MKEDTKATQRAKYLRMDEPPASQFQRIADELPEDDDTLDWEYDPNVKENHGKL